MNLDQYLSRPDSESMAALAKALFLNPDQVRQWRHGHEGRRPNADNCAALERVSNGAMTCEELRPDLAWSRIKDADWPGKRGRPVLEVSRDAIA